MNQIIFGDCRDTMRKLMEQGVRVQTCVTSPPYFGYGVALADNIEITAIFTVASIMRGYLVRRAFVKWGRG